MEIERRIADHPWTLEDGRGNHRVILRVSESAPYVKATIKWRRRDLNPENTGLFLVHQKSGVRIKNVFSVRVTREEGEIVFQAPFSGEYELYYMPYCQISQNWWFPIIDYTKDHIPEPERRWKENAGDEMPQAQVLFIESRTEFDSFYPMEVPASEQEMQEIFDDGNHLLWHPYTEDRRFPIRMLHEIPYRWVLKGSHSDFHGDARPNEYYVFQTALWCHTALHHVTVEFRVPEESWITKDKLTCFQTGGIDWLGRPFSKELEIAENTVQTFWIGVDLPKDKTGLVEFQVIIHTDCGDQVFPISIDVQGENLPHRGDHELWRLSRLRWLNSTIGLDDKTTEPYPELLTNLESRNILCAGKRVEFGENGLPLQIISLFDDNGKLTSGETPILNHGVSFTIYGYENEEKAVSKGFQIEESGNGSAKVTADQQSSNFTIHTQTIIEYDGHMDTLLTVTALEDFYASDMRLSYGLTPSCSKYMMGMGYQGDNAPSQWEYAWSKDRTNHFLWSGGANGGLHIKLKHTQDVWELYTYETIGLPDSWHNNGKGGCRVRKNTDGLVFTAFTGSRTLKKGESLTLRFSLLPSPLKPLDSDAHWRDRYDHPSEKALDLESAKEGGATVVNLHQGERYNRYINYPFCEDEPLKQEIERAHRMGLRYKLYYTVRELTTHAAEFWAVRSLGDEILLKGPTFRVAEHFVQEFFNQDACNPSTGGPWVCEHLVEGCVPAWQTIFKDRDYDCSVATVGLSRWHNYYLEGLRWTVGELGADGIYLDGVGYDRQIMKRVRKVMNQEKPGCLIDFHSGNNFHPQYGLCNVLGEYMELLPSVDSLWIGEAFDYEAASPEYWLTEVSGIPFGLMGDMLHRGGNKWRGMVFGMTPRCNWPEGGSPLPIWNLWREFGMEGCTMMGWWSEQCPVSTSHPDVKATAFVQQNRAMIAVASWAKETVSVQVMINFDKIPFDCQKANFVLPEIKDFQKGGSYDLSSQLTIDPGKGNIILLFGNTL